MRAFFAQSLIWSYQLLISYGASTWVAVVVVELNTWPNRYNCSLYTPQYCPAQTIHIPWDFNSPFVTIQFRGRILWTMMPE